MTPLIERFGIICGAIDDLSVDEKWRLLRSVCILYAIDPTIRPPTPAPEPTLEPTLEQASTPTDATAKVTK